MSPINIPIKPPPRVNTANSDGDDDGGRERKKKRKRLLVEGVV